MPSPATSCHHRIPRRVCVLGLGQMGLVCAHILRSSDRAAGTGELPIPRVSLWGHDPEHAARIAQARTSPALPGLTLSPEVEVLLRDEGVQQADLFIVAIPVQHIREVLTRLAPHLPEGAPFVSVAKGIENTTLLTPTGIVRDVLGKDRPCCVLSGPTIASELARCLPATMVSASDDHDLALLVQRLFGTTWLRVYTLSDALGVEVAGAAKNVIAIAAGILDGLHDGFNAKRALLARGLAEITRLGHAMGAQRETFFGVAGVGDLATTCFSPEGRNRSCGEALGKGQSLKDYLARAQHVVEGVATCRSVMDLARRLRIEMPITQSVYRVLFEGLDPLEAIGELMSRTPREERVG